MSVASGFRGIMSVIDDRVNPIVVKELRQAVKSRFISTILILLLLLLLTTLMMFVMNTESIGEVTASHGASLFYIFQGMLLMTCMLFVPLYVGGRLAFERSSVTSDLLFVSTIRPSSIVWGKLLSGMVVMALVVSACAPFMVVTYLLRGIDPPTIMFLIGLDVLVVLAATMLAILVGAIPVSWIIKIILGLILSAQLLWTAGALSFALVWEMSSWGVGSRMGNWDFWAPVLSFVICWLAGVGMLFFITVAIISPPPSNRVFPLRVYMTCAWALSLGVCIYLADYYGDTEVLVIWAVFTSMIFLAAMTFASSERDRLGPRLKRSIPRNLLLRILAFPLFSGVASGLTWSIFMIGITLAGTLVLAHLMASFPGVTLPGDESMQILGSTGITVLYVLAYVMTAVFIRRWLFRHPAAVASTAAIAMCLIALGCIVPVIIAFAMNPTRWDTQGDWWMLLNPFGAMSENNGRGRWTNLQINSLVLSLIWASIAVLLNLRWYFSQIAAFRPLRDDGGCNAADKSAPSLGSTMNQHVGETVESTDG